MMVSFGERGSFPRPAGRYWYYWITTQLQRVELTSLRIAVFYLMLGTAALYLSDVYLARRLSEPLLSQVQALKGGAEVLLTAGYIYAVTRSSRGQLKSVNTRLERRSDELRHLHRVFRHNLRNDLNLIQGQADLIQEADSTDSTRSRCEQILDTATKMEQYTEQAHRIRQVTETADAVQMDLAETLPRLLASHPRVTDAVEVTTNVPDSAPVAVNPMFREALEEVVDNAIEHNDDDAPAIEITVVPDEGPIGFTEVRITDDGPGIPQYEIESLREYDDRQLQHPSRMGLWFVDWVVRYSNGTLTIAGDDAGTEVRIRVPTAIDAAVPLGG